MANPFPFSAGDVLTAADLNSIGERVAFTPSWTNFTPGNATENWYYVRVNQMLFVFGITRLGSTSSVSGSIRIDVPVGQRTNQFYNCGVLQLRDDSTSTNYAGVFRSRDSSGNNLIDLLYHEVSGSLIAEPSCNASSPFTWTTDDVIRGAFTVGLE